MPKLSDAIPLSKDRTVQEIRAHASLYKRVRRALEQRYSVDKIMAKYRVKEDYVRRIAKMNGFSL